MNTMEKQSIIKYNDTEYRYGFHVKKYPSMVKTIGEVLCKTPLSAAQIYISNGRSKCPPKFDYKDLMVTRLILQRSELYVCIHGCLLYNLAGTTFGEDDENYHSALSSTLQGLIAELDYGVMLGGNIDYNGSQSIGVVVHPGSCKNTEKGLKLISKNIIEALTRVTDEADKIAELLKISTSDVIKRRKIILENAAGEGTKLCSTLEEISIVIKGIPKHLRNQVKLCIDSAHIYGRGLYDFGIRGQIDKFYKDFDEIIGLEHLEVFHFNDSSISKKASFGSRKDRHEQLGMGYIFGDDTRILEITKFMLEAKKHKIPIIGEPPGTNCDDTGDLNGGHLDWEVVTYLLKDTEFPLIESVIL